MDSLAPLLQQHGVALVFVFVLLEQGGLPIPAVPALLVAGALAGSGAFTTAEVLAAAVAASLIADLGWLYAGSRLGRRILGKICRISLEPDSCVRRTHEIYGRFGPRSLAFAKFIPGYSTLGPALAGIAGTPVPVFLLWDGIGTLLWAGIAVFAGMLFAPVVDDLIATLATFGTIGGVVLLAVLVAYVAYKWWWRRRFLRQLRIDRITVPELRELLDRGQAPLIVDVRVDEIDLESGVIPGAVLLRRTELEAIVPLLGATREAIVYCACPNEVSAAQVALELRRRGVLKVRPLSGGVDAWLAAGHALERPRLDRAA